MTEQEHGPEQSTETLLRAALLDDLEAVMSATDTERELRRFQSGLERSHRRSRLAAAAAAGVVGVAAVGAFLAVRSADDGPSLAAGGSSDEVTGDMELTIGGGRQLPDGPSNQTEYRDWIWSGPISLDVGRPLEGTVRLEVDSASIPTDGGMTVLHGWGTAEATLDGQPCEGTFGMSYYADPLETGGALQLRCADGSVLGLSLAVTDHGPSGGAGWGADISVDGGHYRAG